jgi:hypothetical protein
VYRWGRGESVPDELSYLELKKVLQGRADINPHLLDDVDSAFRDLRNHWNTRKRRVRSTRYSAFSLLSQRFGVTSEDIQSYLSRISTESLVQTGRRIALPATGRVSISMKHQTKIMYVEDVSAFVRTTLVAATREPARLLLAGRKGSGRSWRSQLIAAQLARDFVDNVGNEGVSPLPVHLTWNKWVTEIERRAAPQRTESKRLEEVAAALFAAAGLGIEPQRALRLLTLPHVAVVVDGIPALARPSTPNILPTMQALLESTRRLLITGDGAMGLIDSHINHIVRILPLNILQVAARCRQSLIEQEPDLGCLGRLGESASTLASPGIAGRVLAHIQAGTFPAASLLGDAALLATLYACEVLYEAGMPLATPVNSGQFFLDCIEFTDDQRGALRVAVKRDTQEHGRMPRSLSTDAGHWIDDRFDKALYYLLLWLDEGYLSEQAIARSSPSQFAVSPLLERLDPESLRLCWIRSNRRALPRGATDVIATTHSQLRHLGMASFARNAKQPSITTIWQSFESNWPRYCSSVALLRDEPLYEHASTKTSALKRQAFEHLRALFHPDLETHISQGNFRYWGARAAAQFVTEEELATFVDTTLSKLPRDERFAADQELWRAGLGDLTFAAEVALTLAATGPFSALKGARQPGESLCATLAEALRVLSQRDGDSPACRHARFHLADTLLTLARPARLRAAFLELIKPHVSRWEGGRAVSWTGFGLSATEPPRAVELSIAVSTLLEAQVLQVTDPAQLAWDLSCAAERELDDYTFWQPVLIHIDGSSQPNVLPAQIKAHLFKSLQYLRPYLLRFHQELLIERITPAFLEAYCSSSKASGSKPASSETASLRYLLYWLRDVIQAGARPSQQILEILLEVHRHVTETSPTVLSDSPEGKTRRLLTTILEDCGERVAAVNS